MKKLDEGIYKILYWICSMLMLSMAMLIFAQVIARYVFSQSLTWSEEIGRYIFVWMSFLGMAVAIRAKAHVALDILLKYVGAQTKRRLVLINGICIATLSGVMIYSGVKLVLLGGRQSSAALQLPMDMVYLVIPVSGMLMMYFIIVETVKYLRGSEGEAK